MADSTGDYFTFCDCESFQQNVLYDYVVDAALLDSTRPGTTITYKLIKSIQALS